MKPTCNKIIQIFSQPIRYLEYQQFEKKLEACLSSTAVKTKFAAHTARGRDIVAKESAMLGQVGF